MNRAIDLSFSMCFGAGGWSISPEFRCISTVDDSKAPVSGLFRVLPGATIDANKLLQDANTNNLGLTIFEWKDLLNSVLDKMSWLFENRLGCLDDVDETNDTVMFSVIRLV